MKPSAWRRPFRPAPPFFGAVWVFRKIGFLILPKGFLWQVHFVRTLACCEQMGFPSRMKPLHMDSLLAGLRRFRNRVLGCRVRPVARWIAPPLFFFFFFWGGLGKEVHYYPLLCCFFVLLLWGGGLCSSVLVGKGKNPKESPVDAAPFVWGRMCPQKIEPHATERRGAPFRRVRPGSNPFFWWGELRLPPVQVDPPEKGCILSCRASLASEASQVPREGGGSSVRLASFFGFLVAFGPLHSRELQK